MRERSPAPTDVAGLLKKISKLALSKSQYETTEQYNARLPILLGSLPEGSEVTAVVTIADVLGKYDADKGHLVFTSSDIHIVAGSDDITTITPSYARYSGVAARSALKDGKSYVGENAYGVRRRVTERTATTYMVAFEPAARTDDVGLFGSLLAIDMALEVARSERPFLEMVLIGHLKPPFIVDDTHYSDATIDAPVALTIQKHAVIIETPCVGILSTKTKTWYATFKYPPGAY